jgi:hypothetical protein
MRPKVPTTAQYTNKFLILAPVLHCSVLPAYFFLFGTRQTARRKKLQEILTFLVSVFVCLLGFICKSVLVGASHCGIYGMVLGAGVLSRENFGVA